MYRVDRPENAHLGALKIPLIDTEICVEGDCKRGEAQVKQLEKYFASAGKPDKWRSAVDSVLKSFDEANSKWSRHIPFSPACCLIRDLGVQAEALSRQIAGATGQAALPEMPQSDWWKKWVIGGAIAIGGLLTLSIFGPAISQRLTARYARRPGA